LSLRVNSAGQTSAPSVATHELGLVRQGRQTRRLRTGGLGTVLMAQCKLTVKDRGLDAQVTFY